MVSSNYFYLIIIICWHTLIVYSHTNTNINGNIIKHNIRTSMNERTHFFIKICISHILFSMFLLCVRDVWRQGQTAILTQLLFLTIAGVCSTEGRWEPQPSVCKLALTLAFLSPTNTTAAGTCLYSFITPTFFRFSFRLFTQVHLWLTAQSRVCIQHSYMGSSFSL